MVFPVMYQLVHRLLPLAGVDVSCCMQCADTRHSRSPQRQHLMSLMAEVPQLTACTQLLQISVRKVSTPWAHHSRGALIQIAQHLGNERQRLNVGQFCSATSR